MRGKKEKLYRGFNPGKYKMTCCPHCRGRGKSPNKDEGVKVCSQCGGFGWVRKENEFIKGGEK
jgi:DnaJ-class molecular chaperone